MKHDLGYLRSERCKTEDSLKAVAVIRRETAVSLREEAVQKGFQKNKVKQKKLTSERRKLRSAKAAEATISELRAQLKVRRHQGAADEIEADSRAEDEEIQLTEAMSSCKASKQDMGGQGRAYPIELGLLYMQILGLVMDATKVTPMVRLVLTASRPDLDVTTMNLPGDTFVREANCNAAMHRVSQTLCSKDLFECTNLKTLCDATPQATT